MRKFNLSTLFLLVLSASQLSFAENQVQQTVQISPDARSVAMIVDNKPVFYQARDINEPYGKSLNTPSLPKSLSDIQTNNGEKKSKVKINSEWSDEFAQYGILLDDEISIDDFFKEINQNPVEEEKLPPSLADILSYDLSDDLKNKIEEERYKLINDNAVTYGVQSGYAYQLAVIKLALSDRSIALDNLYNFTRFIMQGRILPPVITVVENRVQQTDDDTIHVGLFNYKILSDARLVTQAPNWRSYLLYSIDPPKRPRFTLNPEIKAERQLWDKAVAKGFQKGVMIANRNLYEGWLQLHRDYIGIINYYELLYRGVVSKPYMTVNSQDIVGDSRNMTLGDTVLRISVKPEFILKRDEWQPNTRNGQKGYLGGRGDGAEVGTYQEPVKKVVKPRKKKVITENNETTSLPVNQGEISTVNKPVDQKTEKVETTNSVQTSSSSKTDSISPISAESTTNSISDDGIKKPKTEVLQKENVEQKTETTAQ